MGKALERLEEVFAECESAFSVLADAFAKGWPKSSGKYPPTAEDTVQFLISFQFNRARGLYYLLHYDLWWDAEILFRSLMEAHVRSLYFLSLEGAKLDESLNEYWTVLLSVDDRKASLKAAYNEQFYSDIGDEGSSKIFAGLQKESMFETQPKIDRKTRKAIENKWSFAYLVEFLEKQKNLQGVKSYLHNYGMSSQFVHASAKAYDLIWDRQLRGDDLIHLENGHVARLLSDVVTMIALSLVLGLKKQASSSKSNAVWAAVKAMNSATSAYSKKFDESQMDFYDDKLS